jgi:hypothetical protein
MSALNFIDPSLHKQFNDRDFLDKEKLVGQVYHLMLTGMMDPHPDHRHMAALNIVMVCANSMFPACPRCGTKCEDTRCKNCKIQQGGILGIIN